MKKLLFILLALACLAWSDNYGDRGTYGSTSYGSTAYGEKGYGTSGYGGAENPKPKAKSSKATPSSSSSTSTFGSLLSKFAPASQTASSGNSCSSKKDGAKKAKKSGKAAPSSSSSSMTLGSFLGNLVPTANSASSASGTPAAKPAEKESGPLKPYKFRLVFDLDGLFYDADRISFNGLGVGANVQAFMRSGQGKFFVEYGLGLGLSSWTYEDSYYDDVWEWWVYNIDAQVQGGLQLGHAILRLGAYVGYLKDNDVCYGRYDDKLLVNNYHYGVAFGASYYFSRVELGVVLRDDLSEINYEIGNESFGKTGFISGGFSVGLVF